MTYRSVAPTPNRSIALSYGCIALLGRTGADQTCFICRCRYFKPTVESQKYALD